MAGLLFAIAPALSTGATDALFIFYQPLLPMLFMLWLWTAVVSFFEAYYIRYDACFATEHLKFLLSADDLTRIAESFTTLMSLSVSAYILLVDNGYMVLASYQPGIFFAAVAMLLANPLDLAQDTNYSPQRWFFLDTLRRVMLPFQVGLHDPYLVRVIVHHIFRMYPSAHQLMSRAPALHQLIKTDMVLQVVHFTDFLLADILTSLAKPLGDLAIAACHLTSRRPIAESLVHGFNPGMKSGMKLATPMHQRSDSAMMAL